MAEKAKNTQPEMEENGERKWFLSTFIKFTDKKTSLSLLMDCVESCDIENTVRKHGVNGFHEITGSRSSERYIKEGETISLSFGGELQADKAIPQSSIKIGKGFSTNPITVSVKVNKNANYCIIHYDGSEVCNAHAVMFSVNEEYEVMTKLKNRTFYDSEGQSGKGNATDDNSASLDTEAFGKTSSVTEVGFEERQTFLHELNLKRYQFLVSSVYRCDAAYETEVSIPASLLKKSPTTESLYTFCYFIQREGKLHMLPASFSEKCSAVMGKVSPQDVFCAIAELGAERMTLGKNGGSFISEKDNRIQVNIPEGALNTATDFTFRLEAVDLDRYRAYGEHLPDIFSCLVGFPTSLSIDHEMSRPLKRKAQVYLPVIGDGDEKEILFLHWEGEKVTPLTHKEDTTSPETSYYVEVDHFSTVSAQTKKSNTTVNQTIEATRLLLGQASICTILTYVVPNYIRGMPGLLVDCVELHRVKSVTKEYAEDGYKELSGSRSKDCFLEESGYVTVDVGGNIQIEPGIRKKYMRLRFFKNTSSNRITVPVKFKNQSQILSIITYTAQRKQWEHQVYFSVSDYVEKNAMVRQKAGVSQEPKPKYLPPVLSEKSLLALGKGLPDSTWFEIGVELGRTHDNLTLLLEKTKSTPNAGYGVLIDWIQRNARKPADTLIDDLVAAFEEIGRVDIADIVRKASDTSQPIRRRDFGGDVSKKNEDSSSSDTSNNTASQGTSSGGNASRPSKPKPFVA